MRYSTARFFRTSAGKLRFSRPAFTPRVATNMLHAGPLLLSLLLGALACSSTSGTHDERCDASFAGVCSDYKGVPEGSTYADLCSAVSQNGKSGTFSDHASCDRTNVVGGCEITKSDGTRITIWQYKNTVFPDAASVTCASGYTFVKP